MATTENTDVQVMHGANCWNDHCMVRYGIRISLPYSVGILKHPVPFAVPKFSRPDKMDAYVAALEEKLYDRRFSSVTCTEDNWKELQSCIVASTGKSIGRGF